MTTSVIVAGARTPVGKLMGSLKDFSGSDLGAIAIAGALEKAKVPASAVEYVIMGQVLTAGAGQMPARQAAVAAGIGWDVPSLTINKMCLSGIDAIALADQLIRAGEFDVVVAGGQESMTTAPHLLMDSRAGYKYGDVTAVDHMAYDGLHDVFTDQSMGALTEQRNDRLIGEHVVQTVIGHVVDSRDVAVLVAGATVHQQVRRLCHRLLAARDHDVELARPDQLIGQRDGVDAGQAHLVDRQRGHVPADARGDRGLPCGHLPGPGGEYLPHDHVFDETSRSFNVWEGLFQRSRDRDRAQVTAREVLQRTHEFADRGAGASNNYRCSQFSASRASSAPV